MRARNETFLNSDIPITSQWMFLNILMELEIVVYQEPKMEKLTINLPPIEIARIDILVEGGYYPSRAEFIRAAIRSTLDTHQDVIRTKLDQVASTPAEEVNEGDSISRISGVGIITLDKATVERAIEHGKKLEISVVGMLNLEKGVTPEQVERAVDSVRVYGILRAPPQVKEVLQRKRKRGGVDR